MRWSECQVARPAAFGWRALLKIKHVPEQLFDVIAIPAVFALISGHPAAGPTAWSLLASSVLTVVFARSPPGSTAGSGERRRRRPDRPQHGWT
jgi:hypothetical protein